MAIDEFEDLDELESRLRVKLESIVADLITVFRTDLATYVEKSVRNRFVAGGDFAESLSDETLLSLKKSTAELGETVAHEISESLTGDMDFWFGPDVSEGEGKSFDAHTQLMERLQRVAEATEELLRGYGFPEDEGGGYGLTYSPPAYFVNGKYPPGLAENFWKYLAQLNEVRDSRRQQDLGRRKAVQRHRWDTVDRKARKDRGEGGQES
jgi:hypothetical protein